VKLCGLSIFLKVVPDRMFDLMGGERCFERGQLLEGF
jgi:hypothetical protein